MYVYRVETLDGCGPYNGSKDVKFPSLGVLHPGPRQDGIRDFDSCVHHFGFASIEDFQNWFGLRFIRRNLFKAGFVLNKYRIRKEYVVVGGRQVAFEKKKAKRVGTFDVRSDERLTRKQVERLAGVKHLPRKVIADDDVIYCVAL